MRAKHTPGPWTMLRLSGVEDFRAPQKDDTAIVSVGKICPGIIWENGAEGEANARLIAAAPRMLDTLVTTLGNLKSLKHTAFKQFETIDEWIADVEEAIAASKETP